MRMLNRHLTIAWLEYQDPRDGAVFANALTTRLGFHNAFADLPMVAGSPTQRAASNLDDTTFRVERFRRGGGRPFRGLIGVPTESDQEFLETWVSSPGVANDELTSDPSLATVDMLAVSGHGSGGQVWGDRSGQRAEINLCGAFSDHAGEDRSGRLKCLMVPSCNNVHEGLAALWLPLFNHEEPLHLLLGYRMSYKGGAVGARVMAKFVDALVRDHRLPLIQAWKDANESVKPIQPWAALAAKGARGMNLESWLAGTLPKLTRVHELEYFSSVHPSGTKAKLSDENYEVRWVMGDGTVIDHSNNLPFHAEVGLFDGEAGTIRIRAQRPERAFTRGQEVYLFVYRYRSDKRLSIDKLLSFDAALLSPHPATGQPVVNPEKGRAQRPQENDLDAFRIVVPADTDTLELGFTVAPSATGAFKADGPGGTHGRFLLDLVFDYTLFETVTGREVVNYLVDGSGNSYAAAAGALLRP